MQPAVSIGLEGCAAREKTGEGRSILCDAIFDIWAEWLEDKEVVRGLVKSPCRLKSLRKKRGIGQTERAI